MSDEEGFREVDSSRPIGRRTFTSNDNDPNILDYPMNHINAHSRFHRFSHAEQNPWHGPKHRRLGRG